MVVVKTSFRGESVVILRFETVNACGWLQRRDFPSVAWTPPKWTEQRLDLRTLPYRNEAHFGVSVLPSSQGIILSLLNAALLEYFAVEEVLTSDRNGGLS